MSRTWLSAILFAATGSAGAQNVLTLDEAIRVALEKNYQVQASRNNRDIAKAQNNAGNAGLSPTVSLNGNLSTSNINSYQLFGNGTDQDRRGAVNFGRSGSLNAEWTVFDGFRMFAVSKRLRMNEQVSELELRRQMEATVYDVISAYYGVVRGNELLKAAQQNLRLYEERRKISQLRTEIGSDSRVELLLSQSDENRARAAMVQIELDILNARTTLNLALGRTEDTAFDVADTIIVNYSPSLDELKKNIPNVNTDLMLAKQYELIADQSVREARAAHFPFVTLNGAYMYTRTQSEAGFLLLNRQSGLTGSINARWFIFNGGRNRRLVQERTLLAHNQKLFSNQSALQINGQVYVAYQQFLLNRKIADMELQNLKDAQEVQLIALERYRIGKSGVLESVETQRNLEDVQVRYINALYLSKLAEASLMRANGELVK
jgi:outer membrane protein